MESDGAVAYKKLRSGRANDSHRRAVDDEFRIEHACGSAQPDAPIPIANHHDRVLADGSVIAGTEQATDLSTLAQRSEEVARDELQAATGRTERHQHPQEKCRPHCV